MNRSSLLFKILNPARLAGGFIVLAVVLAACATAPTPTLAPTAAALSEASINIATDAKYGQILVDAKGMTLYMYTTDGPDKVNCAGGCLKAWPPLLTSGNPKLGTGVDAALISSADVGDGTKIVTYNHMPLYYWKGDTKPGDLAGLGVGGVWYLVSPVGKVVGQEASISVATDPKYGKILVDVKGMTLYVFAKDGPDKVNCAGGCLKNWPPVLTSGSPKLGAGVDAALIGTADVGDGTKIVTYNHMPLYYFAKDAKAGDLTGVGVGGVWSLESPDGKVVGAAASY